MPLNVYGVTLLYQRHSDAGITDEPLSRTVFANLVCSRSNKVAPISAIFANPKRYNSVC